MVRFKTFKINHLAASPLMCKGNSAFSDGQMAFCVFCTVFYWCKVNLKLNSLHPQTRITSTEISISAFYWLVYWSFGLLLDYSWIATDRHRRMMFNFLMNLLSIKSVDILLLAFSPHQHEDGFMSDAVCWELLPAFLPFHVSLLNIAWCLVNVNNFLLRFDPCIISES